MAANIPASSFGERQMAVASIGHGRVVLILLYFGYLLSYVDRVIFGLALKPIKHTLQLTDSQLGLLAGVAFAGSYAIVSPFGGFIIDRAKRKLIMAGAIGFWSVATFATAFASTFIGMGFARAGVGAGEGLLHPLAVSLIGDTVPREKRPRAFAIYMSAGAMGAIVAQVLGGLLVLYLVNGGHIALPLIGSVAPWQVLFVAAAIPGAALVVVILGVMREPARTQVAPLDDVSEMHSGRAFLRAYPLLSLAIFAGISTVQMGAYTLTTWLILFFERVHGWSAGKAALWVAGTGGVASLIGCLLAGNLVIALRRRGHLDAPLKIAMVAAVAFAIFASLMLAAPTPGFALFLLPLAMFWGYVPSVAAYSAMGEVLPPPIRARLAGLHTLANGIISNSIGPYLTGALSDHLFPQHDGIRWALVTTVWLASTLGVAILVFGRGDYLRLAARERASVPKGDSE